MTTYSDEDAYCDIEIRDGLVILIFGIRGKGSQKYDLEPMAAVKLANILERAAWDALLTEEE